jgi:hypothetical protein
MFTGATITALNAEAALKAASKNLVPFIPWDAKEVEVLGINFFRQVPNIGSLDVSDAWDEIDTVLVDSSGLGSEGEPALTLGQALAFVIEQVTESASRGFAVVSSGQFQVVLGVFEKL